MQEKYTLFIDESGEAGIGKIRSESSPGASPYMTLGAAIVPNRYREVIEAILTTLSSEIGKNPLHCSKLNHYQILHFARNVVQQRVRLFGVVSRKSTLGGYRDVISEDSTMYYNKCAQYLLERVAWFMEIRGIPAENLEIVFEEANIDYDKMRNLLRACQNKPRHEFTRKLKNICVDRIITKKKDEECLLQVADLVAHALYKCIDKHDKNFGIPEPRYLRELSSRFFGHPETHAVVGAGLYCVHSVVDLGLDPDVADGLNSLVASPS